MDDRSDGDAEAPERIEIGGIGGGLSLAALRALLDPATREAATIDLDLSQIRMVIPAAALHEVVARAMPDGSIDLRDDGITVRPGGGSPGVAIGMPRAGIRLRLGPAGVRVETD